MTRWLIAALVFLAIGYLDHRFGHGLALAVLLGLLILVALFGGSGPRRRGTMDDSAADLAILGGPDSAPADENTTTC